MASSIPDALKSADITRFATRAAQIENAKPAIAYWCNYWIVQQIVTRGLHNTDQSAMEYTVQMMGNLETAKATGNDAIIDEVAAQALIEQFGLEVFSRADNTVRANKASRQTADTFQAAYTFLELLQIWPPLEAEISAKIKYAKYHALRIAKAIKAGEDPNLSNPASEPEPESNGAVALDPNDPEVQALQGDMSTLHASVEDAPDELDNAQSSHAAIPPHEQPRNSSGGGSVPKPAESSSPYNNAESYYQTSKDVSPIGPPSNTAPPSVGGGYFPQVSNDSHASPGLGSVLPSAPADIPDSPLNMSPINPSATSGQAFQPPTTAFPPHEPVYSSHNQPKAYVSVPIPASQEPVDDQAMMQAQKHARWAISALNFEDVPTAVKELRGALEVLGARGPW